MRTFDPGAFRSLFGGRRILWQFPFGAYSVGLDELLPIEVVSCLEDSGDLDLITVERGVRFAAAERTGGLRRNWNGAFIDHAFTVSKSRIERWLRARPKESWRITSTPSSAVLKKFCVENGYQYVGAPLAPYRYFAPKQRLFEAIEGLQLPAMRGEWISPGTCTFDELANRWGLPFVLQERVGSVGYGTSLVWSDAPFRHAAAKSGGEPLRAAPYVAGLSVNINAAVIGGEAYSGPPNVQLSGVAALGARWGGYCGNDFSAAHRLGAAVTRDIQDQTARIGRWMAALGFEGMYGLDFVLSAHDGRAYAVDLNPRWQGSTSLSVEAELADGRLPLAAAEFAYRCGVLSASEIAPWADGFGRPVTGAKMCLRAPWEHASSVGRTLPPGWYRRAERPAFERPSIRLRDCPDDGAWLLTGMPWSGSAVEPGAWIARIATQRSAAGQEQGELNEWALRVVDHVYENCQLSPVPLAVAVEHGSA